ncbi:MAG: sigma 54-interacting transcriptional regulator [Bdellovibrionales bacterium]
MSTRTLNLNDPQSDIGFLSWRDTARVHQVEIGDFLTLGRDPASRIVIPDDFASARHARIERSPRGFLLRDLHSRNGTYVNGTRVLEALLVEGDRIRIGQSELVFGRERAAEDQLPGLTSKNKEWSAQLARIPNIAQSDFPVLITGPSGTGKDLIAQSIHRLSSRRNGPLVSVNCSALSEALVESELFGHLRGSFTGATTDRKGAFAAARGGTLFLDEIGDLPRALQPKLLRALENNQIRPVGSDRALNTDVRIVAATHHDLKRLVFEEKFRSDLYFRLHVVQVETPALEDRMEDFEDLLYGFARRMRVRFSFAAIQRLKTHAWPGNVRELKNVVARAKAFCGSHEVGEEQVNQLIDVLPSEGIQAVTDEGFRPSRSVIKEIEYEMIKSRLIANHGNQRKTAAELGMPKSTLHDRIRNYGIDVEKLLQGSR